MANIIAALTFFLVVCNAASGFSAPKTGPLPGAKGAQQPATPEVVYIDPLGRSTPQGTLLGFMKSATQGEYEQALRYLDTSITGIAAEKLVVGLRTILERGFSGKVATLSNKPEGYPDDNLPPSKELVGTFEIGSGSLDILFERVQRGNDHPIWLFSAETLNKIPEIYKELDIRTIDVYLPKFLVNTWFLSFPLWQWLSFLLIIPLSIGLTTFVSRLFRPLVLSLVHRITKVQVDPHVVMLTGPLRVLVFALAFWSISLVSRSVLTSLFWTYVASTLTVIGATWLCIRLIDIVSKLKQKQLAVVSLEKISLVQLVGKLSQVLALIVGAFVIFHIAGINIAAALTGLGIGGIAIAFAAQKTLENLFGGIMIISDQPIHMGDLCRAGDHFGTVESIGLRSTRIRKLNRTVVSVPNGQLALLSLENFSMRDMILFQHTLMLRYETTADQLRYIIAEVRKMLQEHPKIESSSARVHFIRLGDSLFRLEIFAYVTETVYESFLPIQEDLLLRIMDIVESSGSGFGLPSQTAYLTEDVGLDAAKGRKVMETLRQRRGQGELPFSDFSPGTISEMDGKIDCPPPDSALRDKRKE